MDLQLHASKRRLAGGAGEGQLEERHHGQGGEVRQHGLHPHHRVHLRGLATWGRRYPESQVACWGFCCVVLYYQLHYIE